MFIVNYTVKSRIITLASQILWKIQEFDSYNFRHWIYWNFITEVLEILESEPCFWCDFSTMFIFVFYPSLYIPECSGIIFLYY